MKEKEGLLHQVLDRRFLGEMPAQISPHAWRHMSVDGEERLACALRVPRHGVVRRTIFLGLAADETHSSPSLEDAVRAAEVRRRLK